MSFSALTLAAVVLAPQQPAEGSPQRHWAYVPPIRRTLPIEGMAPIDAFLVEEQRAAGIEANGPADRATLVRRLFLDLVGLPPAVEEVEAFVADDRPEAYGELVERLLASPHYGERWAVPWLDLARYGDSNGFNFDGARSIWLWRDWVIQALNDDMPFDRFTIEQLAGDLLPDTDESTRIATGFHRNTMLNNEGGVDPEEARWERLVDRASTTATTWLGSTFHCAQCHDHKYDPLSQREFYGLVAFFETQDEVELKRGDGAKTLVLAERRDAVAATHLRVRGAYDNKGELVPAHLPDAYAPSFAAIVGDGAPDRLALARWLVSPENPLTARVVVSRIWDQLFGRPLVDTPEDFGQQAPVPQHLDLLDWLATEFVRLGWRQKDLIRAIVRTDTYRRGSAASEHQLELDPDNRLYARGARFRLDGERVRDAWLTASGLLSRKVGGPPVRPLQADTSGVVPTNKVDMRWPVSHGEDAWRRGLYTYWRRTAPFVQLAAFDAPSRELCQVRRERTNTPLQALVGLNDPAALACADALAARMQQHGGDDREKLAFGFTACTSRRPTADELDALAAALAAEPAQHAWSRLAIVLLNLDETISRG